MEDVNYMQLIFNVIPALAVGLVALYIFKTYVIEENQRRFLDIKRENAKHSIPFKLQALERMALFLERIKPGNLLLRVKPYNDSHHDYETLLVSTIEQEFEHNIAQQIYVSEKCWGAIRATKNATITLIRQANMSDKVNSADELREAILNEMLEKQSPSETGLSFIKNETKDLF